MGFLEPMSMLKPCQDGQVTARRMLLSAAKAMSSSSPDGVSDESSPAPGTASSNFTLLYVIIAVLASVILYVAIRYGRSVLSEWRQLQTGDAGERLGLTAEDIAALPTFTYRARSATASPLGGSGSGRGGGRRRTGSGSGKGRAAAGAVECVVCLEELEDGDVVRVLPACRHFFHDRCIDAWLRDHSTCPVCRGHPEPAADVALSPPLPQLRRCGVSPERPTASRVLADILARSPLRSSGGSASGSNEKEMLLSKTPSPRVHVGSRSSSPTPMTHERWSKSPSPSPGMSEIVIVPSKSPSPSPVRFNQQLSARSNVLLEGTGSIRSPIRDEDGGGSLSKSPSPSPVHIE